MEGKLIKNTAGEYHLIVDKCPDFVSISEPITNGFVIASVHNEDINFLKLSLSNCQAIERGYDLDELFEKYIDSIKEYIHPSMCNESDFKAGAEAILELMGDKKFTEEDMRIAYDDGMINIDHNGDPIDNPDDDFNDTIQSLQQTEWDVVIEMELIGECNGNNNDGCFMDSCGHDCGCFKKVPKLDENGCLILKRK